MAAYCTPGFTWVIESTAPDATTVRTTIESDGVNPPSFTVAMQTLGSDKWLSGDWLAPKVTMDPSWDEPAHFCHECGQEFGIDEAGIANHLDPSSPTGIDHEADEDHVPYELEYDDEPRPIGFVKHNGAGEVTFRQAGHPGNDPGPPWAPVYLAVEDPS